VDHEWPGNVRELKNAIFEAVQSFPDVEYLVPAHIAPLNSSSPRSDVRLGSGPGDQPTDVRGWDSDRLDMDWPVEQWSVSDLAGKLPTAQAAFGRLVGRLLKAAIVATRRASLDEPDGRILIHPAMKLLTGNRSLSASKAADLVKRLVKEMEAAQGAPVTDPVVKTAHEISCRLRPAKPAVGFLPHAQPPIKTKKGIES
jgi:hypothetical protein